MKKILLPTDFSCNSKNAISYALNFYKHDYCEFTLIHAYQVDGYVQHDKFVPVPEESFLRIKKEKTDKKLSMLVQEIKMRYPNSNHSFRTSCGNEALINLINKEVRNSAYALIVIGTQGITDAKDVAYGRNTIDIMEKVTGCPIFAIPSHVKFCNIREIVLATGFKSIPLPEEYSFIKELIRKTNSELRILHVKEYGGLSAGQKKNKEILSQILLEVPHTFHTLDHVSVPIGIYCFTESRSSNMITFINKKHNFFENVLFNPLYKKIGNYSKIPVLVLHSAHEKNPVNTLKMENSTPVNRPGLFFTILLK